MYLGRDLEALAQALGAPETPYNYRQNYPIARLAAVELFAQGSGSWLHDLFSAGSGGMCHLPIASMADRASDIANYLPPMPAFDAEQTAMDAYRSLGAMVLLDIEYWKGEPEKRIEDYYSGLLHHLRARTAYVGLDRSHKPIGYSTWTETAGESVTLTRQAAPFGDHLALQRALERHLGRRAGVSALHDRSARQEQAAW